MTARLDMVLAELESCVVGIRARLQRVRELESQAPAECEFIRTMLLADLRSWSPMSVASLSALAPPSEIRDPREVEGA